MTPTSLVMHPRTAESIQGLLQSQVHAVLLVGPDGIGKGVLAQHLARGLLGVDTDELADSPQVCYIAPDEKNTIPIEAIRKLQQFVKLKTTGTAAIRRVILIEHADAMSAEAQNAILKLLEEPPADTVLVLTAGHITALLPTIRSRVQHISVVPPAKETLLAWFEQTYPQQKATLAYFMSGGLPGLMTAILQDDQSHPLAASVDQAKQILQQSIFERLLHAEQLSKQKEQARQLCEALERIAHAGLQQAAAKHDTKRMERWHKILAESHIAKRNFDHNANTKLVLTNLLLAL